MFCDPQRSFSGTPSYSVSSKKFPFPGSLSRPYDFPKKPRDGGSGVHSLPAQETETGKLFCPAERGVGTKDQGLGAVGRRGMLP